MDPRIEKGARIVYGLLLLAVVIGIVVFLDFFLSPTRFEGEVTVYSLSGDEVLARFEGSISILNFNRYMIRLVHDGKTYSFQNVTYEFIAH